MRVHWHEKMELVKVHRSSGYDGRWKITQYVVDQVYPFNLSVPMQQTRTQKVPGMGSATFRFNAFGHDYKMELVNSSLYLDVRNNKIGSAKNNVWIGQIKGNSVTMQFFQPDQMKHKGFHFSQNVFPSTPLKGTVTPLGKPIKKYIAIVVDFPEKRKMDPGPNGKFKVMAHAEIFPGTMRGSYSWRMDKIPGVEQNIFPGGNLVIVEFKGKPTETMRLYDAYLLHVFFKSTDGKCFGENSIDLQWKQK